MTCTLQHTVFSSINDNDADTLDGSSRSTSTTASQPEIEIDGAVHEAVDPSYKGFSLRFVEHLMVATVVETVDGGLIDDLVRELNTAMVLPGVLATHMGRCEAMLWGEHSFMVHIRAVDTASCDVAYRTAWDVYGKHLSPLTKDLSDGHFGDVIVLDFKSNVIGAWDAKWPAIRIAILQFKADSCEEKREGLIEVLSRLPTLFPCVKQVSWGQNVARERAYGEHYGYADADLGVILGFNSCQDMHDLGADPKYWELLNYHGISILEQYQALTLCSS